MVRPKDLALRTGTNMARYRDLNLQVKLGIARCQINSRINACQVYKELQQGYSPIPITKGINKSGFKKYALFTVTYFPEQVQRQRTQAHFPGDSSYG